MMLASEELSTDTIGDLIDALIVVNIRMWHCQDKLYEDDVLDSMDRQQIVDYLYTATNLNLQRNALMDRLDASIVALFYARFGKPPEPDAAITDIVDAMIWEAP